MPTKRICIIGLAMLAVGFVLSTPGASAESAVATWTIVPSPNISPPTSSYPSQLSGVSCTSAANCTAVGTYVVHFSRGTLVEQWDGTTWTVVGSRSDAFSELRGVSCAAATSCAAVGADGNYPLVEEWDGTVWSIPPSPNPSGAISGSLIGVSCTAATSCTAVGNSGTEPLVEQWDGAAWTIVASPSPSGATSSALSAVSCTAATSCTAVGYAGTEPLVEEWDGAAWTIVASPDPSGAASSGLTGVSCTAATSCTAVGYAGTEPLVEEWTGAAWTIVASPDPSSATSKLIGVSCTAATSCTAVGYSEGSTDTPLIEQRDATAWAIVASPNAGSNALDAVSCIAPSNCTAAGGEGETLIEHSAGASFPYPLDGQANVDTTKAFTWSAVAQAQGYYLIVGTTLYGSDLVNSGVLPATQSSFNMADLPTGRALYATLAAEVGGILGYDAISFSAAPGEATFDFPVGGRRGVDPTEAFTWSTIPQAQGYILAVGTSHFGTNLVNSGVLPPAASSYSVPALPAGQVLFATLLANVNGNWGYQSIFFSASP